MRAAFELLQDVENRPMNLFVDIGVPQDGAELQQVSAAFLLNAVPEF